MIESYLYGMAPITHNIAWDRLSFNGAGDRFVYREAENGIAINDFPVTIVFLAICVRLCSA